MGDTLIARSFLCVGGFKLKCNTGFNVALLKTEWVTAFSGHAS
jgi:hypothetical protein